MAQDIGTAASRAVANLTASPPRSEKCRIAKPELILPTTDEEARALQAWAEQPPERPKPVSIDQLGKHLEYMNAVLVSRASDAETGRKRAAVYTGIIGHYPDWAIAEMARRACRTLRWFPTPVECLAILEQIPKPHPEQDTAKRLCRDYWQGRLDSFLAKLADEHASQADIDAAPEQWRRIAVERGLLRWNSEKHVPRSSIASTAGADAMRLVEMPKPKWTAADIRLYGTREAAEAGVDHGWYTSAQADEAFRAHEPNLDHSTTART